MPKRKQRDQDGLYKRDDSPFWWASYIDNSDRRVRRSTRTTDRREADALLGRWKAEAFRAKQWGEQPARSFDELMEAFLGYSEATKRPSGYQRDLDATRHLRDAFQARTVRELTPSLIRSYIGERLGGSVTPATVNRELCVLSAAINYARRELEWDVENSVAGRKLREPEGRVRWITREESQRLIESARLEPQAGHLPDFIRLAIHTGCRKGELLGLEWSRVDLNARLLHLGAEHTKTARRRGVPLNAVAMDALDSRARFRNAHCPSSRWVFCHEDGSPIGDVKRGFATACARAGIEDFRIHDLRHTCAARLVSAGVPLTEVRDLLGHTTIRMTERYAHLAPENVRAAVALLEDEESRTSHV